MMALVRDRVAGVSLTGAPAPRSLATSLRLIPVSRLTRLSVCSFPSNAKSCSATLTKSSRKSCASAGNVMPPRMQSRTRGRSRRAIGTCSFDAAIG